MVENEANKIVYLHDELPASGHPPFREQHILWLLLLLGLLDLSQSADWVHALAIVWSRLGGKKVANNCPCSKVFVFIVLSQSWPLVY